jgi:hypothetical protein
MDFVEDHDLASQTNQPQHVMADIQSTKLGLVDRADTEGGQKGALL